MGKVMLVCRLAARDLRYRPAQAVLLLLAIMAAATTLTLALALHGVTSQPYQQTRAATAGPDVVAQLSGSAPGSVSHRHGHGPVEPAVAKALVRAVGVAGHSGPYPVAAAVLRARGIATVVEAEGRDQALASVDQPEPMQGSWVRSGGVVIERTFAEALGVRVGDRITLNGRPFTVTGIAVTAASPPYPNLCYVGCYSAGPQQVSGKVNSDPGLIWLTQADARNLATPAQPLTYVLNLKLKDPAAAPAFANAYNSNPNSMGSMIPWQSIRAADGLLVTDEQQVLLPGSWLLGLLAVASVAVLAGGRMAEQARRAGLLKAVGATPKLVAAVLLAEHMALALIATAAGLAAGWLAAPLLTSPGAGLVGTPGAPSLTLSTVALVTAVALAVAVAATLVPATRAARTSTVTALGNAARPPRRRAALIMVSARLPVPLLLGLRLAARRPRRFVLSMATITVTVTGLVAVLAFHATTGQHRFGESSRLSNPVADRDGQVLLVITVVLVVLAAVNAILTAWATVLDARRPSAVARALGVTPQQITAGVSAAQVLPALPGIILGIPAGIGLFAAANHAGIVTIPPVSWLVAVLLGTLLTVAGLTAIPARAGARRPVAEILQSETA
jgi:ABC-type lipoprotein release transport system permease subunit